MASRASLEGVEDGFEDRVGHADDVPPGDAPPPSATRDRTILRSAILVGALWAAGTLALTLVSLMLDVRESGWQRLAEPSALVYALLLTTASFLLRFLRWHLLARQLAPGLSLRASFVANAIGFGLMLTPARAGEALKLLLLRQRTAVPVASSSPVFLLEKLCEAVSLAGLALGASFFLPWAADVAPMSKFWVAGAALAALALGITFRAQLIALAPRLPLLGGLLRRPKIAPLWEHLARGVSQVLTWPMLLAALALSFAARLCDGIAIVWIGSVYGITLSWAAGWFLIGSSGFLGGVSMLPGGVGVAEATLISLFVAFGAGPATAVAAALTARILIFWVWVAFGLALALRYAVRLWTSKPAEDDR